MAEEMVALVDRNGVVVGSSPRSVVRRANLLHAATAVLVRNDIGQIYLHQRSLAKDWAPGLYDCAAGGIVQDGEDPAASAVRELAEELGISPVTLRPLGTSLYEDDGVRCYEHCYEATWSGPIEHVDEEVVWGDWVTLEELDVLLADSSWGFVPDTRKLLTRLAVDGAGDYGRLASLGSGRA